MSSGKLPCGLSDQPRLLFATEPSLARLIMFYLSSTENDEAKMRPWSALGWVMVWSARSPWITTRGISFWTRPCSEKTLGRVFNVLGVLLTWMLLPRASERHRKLQLLIVSLWNFGNRGLRSVVPELVKLSWSRIDSIARTRWYFSVYRCWWPLLEMKIRPLSKAAMFGQIRMRVARTLV